MATESVERHIKLTVLISGNGSNLQALIDACNRPTAESSLPNTSVIRVISNRKDAFGLKRAAEAKIPTLYHNLIAYKRAHEQDEDGVKQARAKYDRDLATHVLADKPDLVVCAGFMHILAPTFLDPVEEAGIPVINLHPALPGQYNGTHAIERAYEDFQKGKVEKTGVMVHYVISEVDMGEPILTKDIEIRKSDTLDDLETKIHETEWQVIVEGTRIAMHKLPRR